MKKQSFTIQVSRKEFLTLPIATRRRLLRLMTEKFIEEVKKDCPGCAGEENQHSEYCIAYERTT